MVSLTRIRWITGGKTQMAPRECATLRRSTRTAMRTSWDESPMKCFGRAGPNRRPAMALPILNRMHKYVVSTTLSAAPWQESTIISGNVVEEIAKLKQQPGKDIIIDGSARLVQSLMGTDLIDEYRFLVQPFIMGRGRRFFPDGTPPTKLRLVESTALSFGSLALVYRPDKQ